MEIKKFKNHFLIAMPNLNDSIFKKSIILLCEHNEEGSMGLIINKPVQTEKKQSERGRSTSFMPSDTTRSAPATHIITRTSCVR